MRTLIFLVFTIFSVTFVAAQDTGEGEVVVLAESASPVDDTIPLPDADPAAPVATQSSFHAVLRTLADMMALHESRQETTGEFYTLEEGSEERETTRIGLRKMTGQIKKFGEEIATMLMDLATLRDKKQQERQNRPAAPRPAPGPANG